MKKITNNNWLRFFAIIIPYVLIVSVFQIIGYNIAGASLIIEDKEFTSYQRVVITFSTLIGTIITLVLFMKFVDKEPFKNLGLHWKGKSKDLLLGGLLGAVIMCFAYFFLNKFRGHSV